MDENNTQDIKPASTNDDKNPKDTNEAFKTPEEIAKDAFKEDAAAPDLNAINATKASVPKKRFAWFRNMSRRKKIILITSAVVLVLASAGAASWWFVLRDTTPGGQSSTSTKKKKEAAKPTTVAANLTGLQVASDINDRPVIGVMIENSPDSRPQSGLKDAGVVFEAVAEGGITRFLALFQDTQPTYVGPIRSVRPYYLEWLLGFDAAIAHVGGSPDALSAIKSQNIKDLDQFANAGSYERVKSRFAPHNVYSSIQTFTDLSAKKGFGKSQYTGLARADKEAPAATPTAKTVDTTISSALYNVHWDYDQPRNLYLRNQAGKAHIDEKSNEQIAPKVVVVLVMQKGIMSDGKHTSYATTGSGKAYVFQNGVATEGTWQKTSSKSQLTLTDTAGASLKLIPGKTWITVVDGAEDVVYKP